jgi:cytochrome c biogenesis protein CcdA
MLIFSLALGLPYMITTAAAGPGLERLGRRKAGMGWVRHASGVALAGFGTGCPWACERARSNPIWTLSSVPL